MVRGRGRDTNAPFQQIRLALLDGNNIAVEGIGIFSLSLRKSAKCQLPQL